MAKEVKGIEAEFRDFQRSLRVRSWQTNKDAGTSLQEDVGNQVGTLLEMLPLFLLLPLRQMVKTELSCRDEV